MAVSRAIRKVRCEDALDVLIKDGFCCFFTLTTPDVVDIHTIRERWRNLRHWLVRYLNNCTGPLKVQTRDGQKAVKRIPVKYVMNFEIHPRGHGWHVHSIWNRFIPLNRTYVLDQIKAFGFGRVDVRRVTTKGISEYLTKHALKAYHGVSRKEMERNPSFRLRLVNASRGLPVLSDYAWRSDEKDRVRHLHTLLPVKIKSRMTFRASYGLCSLASSLGIRHSLELGCLMRSYLDGSLGDFCTHFEPRPDILTQEDLPIPQSPGRRGISTADGRGSSADELRSDENKVVGE